VATEALVTLREALSNVARHARAHRVEVVLGASGSEVRLDVADDGVGIPDRVDDQHESKNGGRGLANMRDRAEVLGGSFSVAPRPGGGTLLSWRAPL